MVFVWSWSVCPCVRLHPPWLGDWERKAWWIMHSWSRQGMRLAGNGRNANKGCFGKDASYYFTGTCSNNYFSGVMIK